MGSFSLLCLRSPFPARGSRWDGAIGWVVGKSNAVLIWGMPTSIKPPVLTLVLQSPSEEGNPLDASGENKRLMIAAADSILDAAIARLPGYLSQLPPDSRPSPDQLSQALRREYRIKGPQVEVDVSVHKSRLPENWLSAIDSQPPEEKPVPGVVVLASRITGWFFGVGKKDQDKIIDQVHKEALEKKKENVIQKVGSGLAELLGVALEIEVISQAPSLVNSNAIRQVSLRRRP